MTVKALIDVLNNLTAGEVTRLSARVSEAREEARVLGLDDVAAILEEALSALALADLKTFRKRVNHAVSRLGHVKESPRT